MVGCFLFSWWYHLQVKVFKCDTVQFICFFFLLLFVFSIFWSFSQSLLNLLQAFALTAPPKLLLVRSPVSSMLLIQPPRLNLHSLWQSSYLLLLEISTFYPLDPGNYTLLVFSYHTHWLLLSRLQTLVSLLLLYWWFHPARWLQISSICWQLLD